MRNITILFIFMFTFAFASCNENKPQIGDLQIDNDAIGSDSDGDTQDVVHDSDKISDLDNESDESSDADVDTVVECLDLRYNENTLKTGFPFKDKNGNPTFCRPGCDTPTETDPQCVRNIWEWDNWSEYQEYLAAEKKDPDQEWERECYPWPCKLPDMKASTGGSLKTPCDRFITVNGFEADSGTVWTHGMSDGVVGMGLYHSSGRVVEYNPEKDKYMTLGKKSAPLFFNKGRYIVSVFDSFPNKNPLYRGYVVSIFKNEDKYYYELIYDNEKHNAFFSRPPFVGKDWVLIQVCEGSNGPCDVKYAKSDKWEWHSLNIGKVQEGNIVDDRLSFIINDGVNDRQIFYCNLSKYPSSFNDCTRVTRKLESEGYEEGHSPRIDEDDKTRLIYYINGVPEPTLVEVKFEDGKEPAHNEIKVDRRFQTEKVKGKTLMYTTPDNDMNFMSCWYRFDKNKSYCLTTHDWVTQHMAFATFTEKWQIYKGNVSFTLRDWECYCNETGICPLEE